jgi:hypothetical protein
MASLFHNISVAMAQATKECRAFVVRAFRKLLFSLQLDNYFLHILTFLVTALFPVVTPKNMGTEIYECASALKRKP